MRSPMTRVPVPFMIWKPTTLRHVSNHFLLLHQLELQSTIDESKPSVSYYHETDPNKINSGKNSMAQTQWDTVISSQDSDMAFKECCKYFCYQFHSHFKKHVFELGNRRHKTWVTEDIVALIQQKQKLHTKCLGNPCPNNIVWPPKSLEIIPITKWQKETS